MFIDPEHKRAKELQTWYENIDKSEQFNSITGGVNGLNGLSGGTLGANGNGSMNGQITGERPDNFKLAEELIEELAFHNKVSNGYTVNTGNSFNESKS
jgi:hypothetical protein